MKMLTAIAVAAAKSVAVLAAKKGNSGSPLYNTPFGQAFLRYDGRNSDRDFTAAIAAWSVGNAGMKHFIARTIYGTSPEDIRAGAFCMDSSEANFENLMSKEATALLSAARLRRKGKKIVASIPCGRFVIGNLFYPDVSWFGGRPLAKNRETVRQIVARVQASKFRSLLTLDRALDAFIPIEDVLEVTPQEDWDERVGAYREHGYINTFKSAFPKMRFMRPSLDELATSDVRQRVIGTTFGTQVPFDEISIEHPAFAANDSIACDILQTLLGGTIVAFLDVEFDEQFLSILTGSDEEPPLSLIGNWLAGTLEFQLDPNDDRTDETIGDAHRVSSLGMSKKESLASPVLPYDPAAMQEGDGADSRLCIDNNGTFYWLPVTDNVDQYEQELETTFTNDKGEWSIIDVLNPQNVLKFDDGEGRIRRMPRKVQANRLIYTDFKAGLLAYTSETGAVKTYDISSFRPVTASHKREFLDLPLDRETPENEDFLGMLNSAIRQAIKIAGTVASPHQTHNIMGLEDGHRQMFDERFGEFINGRSSADIVDYVADLTELHQGRYGVDQDLIDALHDLRFKDISPQSFLPELRIIYDLLNRYSANLVEDFEHSASVYRLLPTLERIGMITTLVNEAPHYNRIVEQDRQLRAPYTEEPEDYRTVEIPEIPFTKGVKLMPHQVKIFAKLKKFPKRFTLDVSAGGGKTFTAVLVCAMYMKHAGIRKPLIVCPNILLKNYFQDATYATAGAMNIIAINSDTLKRWGAERLTELIKQAPINTVVVASFDSMARGTTRVYGTRQIQVNTITEFLQQFDFDMVVTDESHRIKRTSSNTNRNVARVTARAKVTGIMTGTLIYNGTADVVGQFNIMDPTIFGSDTYFDDRYMTADRGVKRAKTESPREVQQRIASQTAYVQVTRKEWAALLPPRIDEFTGESTEAFHILNNPEYPEEIQMTQAQQDYYNLMLQEIREQILEDAQTDKSLQRLLQSLEGRGGRGNAAADEDSEDDDDAQVLDDIMTKLNPYLARLEIFLANPTNSREQEFTGRWSVEDRQSPKAKKVVQIVRQHIERGYVGKVLVFTQYNESAQGIYDALPPELKALAVHYTAADKTPLTQFETDPSKMILIGNERSIGTGLNLQMASRIIRTESTWNWGALEQAESRVNRPVPKSVEVRKAIYLDWIIVNNTIDVTKIGRMISKAVESYKFINARNPMFQEIPALEAVKMTLENILLRNNIHDEEMGMMLHFRTYEACRRLEEMEFQQFRDDPNKRDEPYELNGGMLPGSGLLKNVPYVPGMALYNPQELGLVPMIEYITQTRRSTLALFDPKDLVLHCEEGDGRCVGFRRNKRGELNSVTIELPDGSKGTYDLASVFVVTKANIDVDTRRQVAEKVMTVHTGRPVKIVPERAPLRVGEQPKPTRRGVQPPAEEDPEEGTPNRGRIKLLRTKPVPNADTKLNGDYNMYVLSIGHMYCLTTTNEDPDTPFELLQEEHDFMQVRPYYYAKFVNPTQLSAWYTAAKKLAGFHKESREQIEEMIELMTEHRPDAFFQNVMPAHLRDFWRNQKTPARAGTVMPFVSIEDNGVGKRPTIYVIAFKHQNPQFRLITSRARVPGVTWETTEDDQFWYLAPTQKALLRKLKEVNEAAPIKNYEKLVQKVGTLRPTRAR